VSRVWRQTISDELAAQVDAQRGALTMQEYTTFALAGAAQQLAELRRRIEDLEIQIARVAPAPPPAAPAACAVEMLSF